MRHPEPGFDEGQAMQPLPGLASAADNMLSDRNPSRATAADAWKQSRQEGWRHLSSGQDTQLAGLASELAIG